MDAVSGVAAVVSLASLAIQLAGTVQVARQFLIDLQKGRKELLVIVELLDQLSQNLNRVRIIITLQKSFVVAPASYEVIVSALHSCETRVKTLEDFIKTLKASPVRRHHLQKAWGSLRIISKKEDIQTLQLQLRDAILALQMALSTNAAEVQLHHMQLTAAGMEKLTVTQKRWPITLSEQGVESPVSRVDIRSYLASRTNVSLVTRNESGLWYWGLFGIVNVRKKRKSITKRGHPCYDEDGLVVDERIITIRPSFLRYSLDLSFAMGSRLLPRTLNIYYTLSCDAPIFKHIRTGDFDALVRAIQNRQVSPFVTDENGTTLLHWAAMYCRADVCQFLIEIGVDVDRCDIYGTTAVGWSNYRQSVGGNDPIGTLRILAKCQDSLPASDVSKLLQSYWGPPEGIDLMSSMDSFSSSNLQALDARPVWPMLATALGRSVSFPGWEPTIHKLLRCGADLHAPVPRSILRAAYTYYLNNFSCELMPYGTPLDELLEFTESPSEARTVAQRWLCVLETEGYDTRTYLENEKALHAPQFYFTWPARGFFENNPRQLIFELGTHPPSVHWDWWINPYAPAAMVLEEFKGMIGLCANRVWEDDPWMLHWPFDHLDVFRRPNKARPASSRKQEGRMEKKAKKLTRAMGKQEQARVPGMWPD